MNNLLVMKFGGTSMGSADRMRVAADIISKEQKKRPVLVVVSAMSKVTDLLLESLRHAEVGDRASVDSSIESLLKRHIETCNELLSSEAAIQDVEQLVSEFRRIANGILMLGERPPRSVDEAIAIGERLSPALLARYMDSTGTSAKAVNGGRCHRYGCGVWQRFSAARSHAGKMHSAPDSGTGRGVAPIVTGFNGATADGRPTTLGRGGSDFSASILAAALDAQELWIWTDVDGIMTADPGWLRCGGAGRGDLRGSGGTGVQRREGVASAHSGAADREADSGLEQEQLCAAEARDSNRVSL